MLSNEDVQDIVRLLDELPFDELHLTLRGFSLSLRRTGDGGWAQALSPLSAPDVVPPAPEPPGSADIGTAAPVAAGERDLAGLVAVRASLMGTFYRAPSPGAAPFVEVGSPVAEDTVVGIIETMKLMNSVHAGACGRVVEISVANAQFTDQGAVLMLIEPEPC